MAQNVIYLYGRIFFLFLLSIAYTTTTGISSLDIDRNKTNTHKVFPLGNDGKSNCLRSYEYMCRYGIGDSTEFIHPPHPTPPYTPLSLSDIISTFGDDFCWQRYRMRKNFWFLHCAPLCLHPPTPSTPVPSRPRARQ